MREAIDQLGDGPLTEPALKKHIWPLFSRVLQAPGIYLANHSLGRPLDQLADDVAAGLSLWYERLDGAWDDDAWPDQLSRFRGGVAELIGVPTPDAIVPKASAGQGLRAVLNAYTSRKPLRIVTTRGEFDSIDFILKTYRQAGLVEIDWVEPSGVPPLFDSEEILAAITPATDLVVVSMAFFGTGQLLGDLEGIAAKAHEVGAKVLVDAYHAAGVIPIDMEELDVDFMIGGSYKYTRGGPGAAWLAIHPRHLGQATLDTGWFAKESPFSYARPEEPRRAPGGDGWMESTPPILTLYQAMSGLEFTLGIGIERLRDYSLEQQRTLREAFGENGVPCFEPSIPEEFGAFTLVASEDAQKLAGHLAKAGVITDARGGYVRFGPDILNSSDELRDAARITAQVLGTDPA